MDIVVVVIVVVVVVVAVATVVVAAAAVMVAVMNIIIIVVVGFILRYALNTRRGDLLALSFNLLDALERKKERLAS